MPNETNPHNNPDPRPLRPLDSAIGPRRIRDALDASEEISEQSGAEIEDQESRTETQHGDTLKSIDANIERQEQSVESILRELSGLASFYADDFESKVPSADTTAQDVSEAPVDTQKNVLKESALSAREQAYQAAELARQFAIQASELSQRASNIDPSDFRRSQELAQILADLRTAAVQARDQLSRYHAGLSQAESYRNQYRMAVAREAGLTDPEEAFETNSLWGERSQLIREHLWGVLPVGRWKNKERIQELDAEISRLRSLRITLSDADGETRLYNYLDYEVSNTTRSALKNACVKIVEEIVLTYEQALESPDLPQAISVEDVEILKQKHGLSEATTLMLQLASGGKDLYERFAKSKNFQRRWHGLQSIGNRFGKFFSLFKPNSEIPELQKVYDIGESDKLDEIVDKVSPDQCKTVRTILSEDAKIDPENLLAFERLLGRFAMKRLIAKSRKRDSDWRQNNRDLALEFGDASIATPIIVLGSPNYIDNGNIKSLSAYAQRITDEWLVRLSGSAPVTASMLRLIREHPDDFHKVYIDNPDRKSLVDELLNSGALRRAFGQSIKQDKISRIAESPSDGFVYAEYEGRPGWFEIIGSVKHYPLGLPEAGVNKGDEGFDRTVQQILEKAVPEDADLQVDPNIHLYDSRLIRSVWGAERNRTIVQIEPIVAQKLLAESGRDPGSKILLEEQILNPAYKAYMQKLTGCAVELAIAPESGEDERIIAYNSLLRADQGQELPQSAYTACRQSLEKDADERNSAYGLLMYRMQRYHDTAATAEVIEYLLKSRNTYILEFALPQFLNGCETIGKFAREIKQGEEPQTSDMEFAKYFGEQLDRLSRYALSNLDNADSKINRPANQLAVAALIGEGCLHISPPAAGEIISNPNFRKYLSTKSGNLDSDLTVALLRHYQAGRPEALDVIFEALEGARLDANPNFDSVYNSNIEAVAKAVTGAIALSRVDDPDSRNEQSLALLAGIQNKIDPSRSEAVSETRLAAAIIAQASRWIDNSFIQSGSSEEVHRNRLSRQFVSSVDACLDSSDVELRVYGSISALKINHRTAEVYAGLPDILRDTQALSEVHVNFRDMLFDLISRHLDRIDGSEQARLADVMESMKEGIANQIRRRIAFGAHGDHAGAWGPRPDNDTRQMYAFNNSDLTYLAAEHGTVSDRNWSRMLASYTLIEGWGYRAISAETAGQIRNAVRDPAAKDLILNKLREQWADYLASGQTERVPVRLAALADSADKIGGMGDLKHAEALCDLYTAFQKALDSKPTADKTKKDLPPLLAAMERRVERERWGDDERSSFYGIMTDILSAAPSLGSDVLALCSRLSAKELKQYAQRDFPIFHAQLVLRQKTEDRYREQIITYNPRELAVLRRTITELAQAADTGSETDRERVMADSREAAIADLKNNFKKRFGLNKVPEQIGPAEVRMIQNTIRYLGNINQRDTDKEARLAWFLALQLNGQWDAFRRGEAVAPEQYFEGDQLKRVQEYLKSRGELDPQTAELIGIEPERMADFQRKLQTETLNRRLGNIETIDIKLGSALRNFESLADPDAYTDPIQRALITLVSQHGKAVGQCLAKLYQRSLGRTINFSEVEQSIAQTLEQSLEVTEWKPDSVKKIQEGLKIPSLVAGVLERMRGEKAEEKIAELNKTLIPGERIVEIFNRFGEGFKPESGAFALSVDLAYLENLVVKERSNLSDEEFALVDEYLGNIRKQMTVLESILSRSREYAGKLSQAIHGDEILQERVMEIEKALSRPEAQQEVVSRMTTDMNLIIENMRQCLGCLRREYNNDTNLTFGDRTKFFILSQGPGLEKSIADQICYAVPITSDPEGKGDRGLGLVLDQVYGSKSSDILASHVAVAVKKLRDIAQEFPNARISVLVTDAALNSAGVNGELLAKILKDELSGMSVEPFDGSVDIPRSAGGDHYVEFGGKGARDAGIRSSKGILIRR